MSVIIKGMDIPEGCSKCEFRRIGIPDICDLVVVGARGIFTSETDNGKKRPNWCPLAEIPNNHGRLIDADAEIKRYGLDKATKYGNETEDELNFSYSQMLMYEIADLFENAPTILDAEGEDEE